MAEPINVDVSWSDESMMLPVPLGVRVRLSLEIVPIMAGEPLPRLRVVADIPSVALVVNVARLPDVMVVSPDAVRVVSSAAMVRVLLPASRVSVFAPPDTIDPTPVKLRESMSRVFPSIEMLPRLPVSSIVIDPVVADTSNSVKLIAVAPPLIDVRDVPLSVVVPVKLNVSVLTVKRDPIPPLSGDRVILPVVDPPMVRV